MIEFIYSEDTLVTVIFKSIYKYIKAKISDRIEVLNDGFL